VRNATYAMRKAAPAIATNLPVKQNNFINLFCA